MSSCDIPKWIQASEIYRNSINNDLELSQELCDKRFIKENTNIDNIDDFIKVLQCIDYWNIDYENWPNSIYEFISY